MTEEQKLELAIKAKRVRLDQLALERKWPEWGALLEEVHALELELLKERLKNVS